jgi:hypothetical protein
LTTEPKSEREEKCGKVSDLAFNQDSSQGNSSGVVHPKMKFSNSILVNLRSCNGSANQDYFNLLLFFPPADGKKGEEFFSTNRFFS